MLNLHHASGTAVISAERLFRDPMMPLSTDDSRNSDTSDSRKQAEGMIPTGRNHTFQNFPMQNPVWISVFFSFYHGSNRTDQKQLFTVSF
jgi:hypothetical protein